VPGSDESPLGEQELELLRELIKAQVPFMLVGLGAAVLQGADAVTKDIDLWFRSIAHPGLAEAAARVGGAFDGLLDFDTEYRSAIEVALVPDLVIKVLPIERVLASKRAANRPKDQAVIPALEAAIAAIKEAPKR
jgi:hypothetical protein